MPDHWHCYMEWAGSIGQVSARTVQTDDDNVSSLVEGDFWRNSHDNLLHVVEDELIGCRTQLTVAALTDSTRQWPWCGGRRRAKVNTRVWQTTTHTHARARARVTWPQRPSPVCDDQLVRCQSNRQLSTSSTRSAASSTRTTLLSPWTFSQLSPDRSRFNPHRQQLLH